MNNKKRVVVFIILSLTAGMAYFTPLLKFTFYDQMMTALQLDDVQVNVLSSVYALVNIVMYPISGYLGDRFSARKMISLSMFALAALTVWYAFTTDYTTLIVIHALFGVFAVGSFWCPYLKAIRSLGDESIQSKLFGMSEATRGLGQAAVGFAAIWLISTTVSVETGFSRMLLMTAAVYVGLGILVLALLPKTSAAAAPAGQKQKEPSRMLEAIKNPGTWITTLMLMSGFCLWLLSNTYLTTYSVRVLGISQELASTLGIIRSYAIVFIAGFGGGWLLDKFTYKGKTFIIIFLSCAGVIAALMSCTQLVVLSIFLTVVLTLITNVIKSTYWSVLGQAGIPVAMTASATGVISFFVFIPESFITVICGSWLRSAEAAGNVASAFSMIFALMIAFAVVGSAAALLLLKRTKKLRALQD